MVILHIFLFFLTLHRGDTTKSAIKIHALWCRALHKTLKQRYSYKEIYIEYM